MNRSTNFSAFCTRESESEMPDVLCWAFLNSSITSTTEARWKAFLSSSDRLSIWFCNINATAPSNALFFDGTGPMTLWVEAGPEGAGLAGLEGAGLAPLDDLSFRVHEGIRNPLILSRFLGGILSSMYVSRVLICMYSTIDCRRIIHTWSLLLS